MEFNVSITKFIGLFSTIIITSFSMNSFANEQSESNIANRIAPVGDVYLDGEIKSATAASSPSEAAGPRTAQDIYNTYCMACHATGAAGAPIKGNADAWKPRIAQGNETLIKHAIAGFNAMPARGTCGDCTDEELASTVDFIIQ